MMVACDIHRTAGPLVWARFKVSPTMCGPVEHHCCVMAVPRYRRPPKAENVYKNTAEEGTIMPETHNTRLQFTAWSRLAVSRWAHPQRRH